MLQTWKAAEGHGRSRWGEGGGKVADASAVRRWVLAWGDDDLFKPL